MKHWMVRSTMNGNGLKRGNALLLVIILSALMALAISMALVPMRVSAMRQKEDLLIYRGEHLAHGIRDFYFRFGRFPFDLQELVEVEPRVVRKIYLDPMTEDGQWELVHLGEQNQSSLSRLQDQLTGREGRNPSRRKPSISSMKGQIIGLKSRSTETGYREYQQSRIYNDWFFNALQGSQKDPLKMLNKSIKQGN